MKLSKTQQEAIDLMKSGWKLKRYMRRNRTFWLQRESFECPKRVSKATMHALVLNGLIYESHYDAYTDITDYLLLIGGMKTFIRTK